MGGDGGCGALKSLTEPTCAFAGYNGNIIDFVYRRVMQRAITYSWGRLIRLKLPNIKVLNQVYFKSYHIRRSILEAQLFYEPFRAIAELVRLLLPAYWGFKIELAIR